MIRSLVTLTVPLIAAILASGCGSPSVGTVTGLVKQAGKPLPGGTITFLKRDSKDAEQFTATVNDDGTFTMDDLPFGDYLIGIAPKSNAVFIDNMSKGKLEIGVFDQNNQPVPQNILDRVNTPPQANAVGGQSLMDKYSDPYTSGILFTHDKSPNEYNPDLP
jgi:hypothetical protein